MHAIYLYTPDHEQESKCVLCEDSGGMQLANATYVWLPLLPRVPGRPDQGFTIVDRAAWSPRDYCGKGPSSPNILLLNQSEASTLSPFYAQEVSNEVGL